MMIERFNLKNIRTLLMQGFTAEELRRFCYDNPEFRPVYEQFAEEIGKDRIIDKLIEYAERKELIEILLARIKELNPAKYAAYEPYSEVALSATDSSGINRTSQSAEVVAQPISQSQPKRFPAHLVIGGIGLIILLSLIVFGLNSFSTFSPTNPAPEAIAKIFDFTPQVVVQRAGTNQPFNPDKCTDLYYGDKLQVDPGASALIFCTANKQLLDLPGEKQIEINCGQEMTALGEVITLKRNQTILDGICRDPTQSWVEFLRNPLSRGVREQSLLLLTPRNSVITTTQPTFTWQSVQGAGGYRLTVTLSNGESWSKETSDNSLAYPADAPPLVADGLPNIVELTSGDDAAGTAVDKTKLRVLTATAQTELAQAEAEIQALPLDRSSQHLFLAQLYRQHEMWSAALEQLVPLAQTQQPPSATLWQQVGDLYMQVELYAQAEQSYNEALAAARANEDLRGQAAAQFGLAHTAMAFDETDQALEHLKAAEPLFRQTGQTDLAEVVAQEQGKLKEE